VQGVQGYDYVPAVPRVRQSRWRRDDGTEEVTYILLHASSSSGDHPSNYAVAVSLAVFFGPMVLISWLRNR
jgi:hypothetical protein